ncbi:MAG TPA: restriction endonuclease subunit S, partial [Bryobacteraceae bacterium]|nr:restriction endonuclease subunit S [Bryobacteraceae bacterium]
MTPLSQEWNRITLGELVRQESPICYGVLKPGEFTPDGVPLVRIMDLEGDKVRTNGLFRISSALDREFSRSRLRGGELLLSIQGTIGRVALAEDYYLSGANISRTIARIDMREDADPRFYRHWFLSDEGQKKLFDTVVGTTRASLNLGDVRLIQLPHPPKSEQARIAEVLDNLDEAIGGTESVVQKLETSRQGLLRDLLTLGVDKSGNVRSKEDRSTFQDTPLGPLPRSWSV